MIGSVSGAVPKQPPTSTATPHLPPRFNQSNLTEQISMPTVTFHIPEEKKDTWQRFLEMIHGEHVGAGKIILPWIEQFVENR